MPAKLPPPPWDAPARLSPPLCASPRRLKGPDPVRPCCREDSSLKPRPVSEGQTVQCVVSTRSCCSHGPRLVEVLWLGPGL